MYFVGFAGFGPQKVFAEEIALAARRVDERYGIADRRVLLVNDRRDFDRYPLASRTALARTLAGIGARMNRDRDVLFLALSSHGKKDPYLVVENGALPLDKLTADALAEILRESQIRWKVLVISACYAGAFIEPLRDPYTVIITAAAPDRTSFGCNDQRALTYFGQAFYRDALPECGEPARGVRHRGRGHRAPRTRRRPGAVDSHRRTSAPPSKANSRNWKCASGAVTPWPWARASRRCRRAAARRSGRRT